jgi:DNA-binding PadR family transcriptional regulator
MYRSSVYAADVTDGPMREPTFLVLTALAGGPQHGYAVIEDIAGMTGGRVRLRAGTLYAALDRLRTEGLIEVDREEVVQSRLRRYYRLTGAGERSLTAETARLRAQATIAERRLRLRRTHLGGATT